jgi:hypothetical protein
LKSNKAAGPDDILPEFIKNGGFPLKQKMYQIIVKIWKQEKTPSEWTKGTLCSLYKRG